MSRRDHRNPESAQSMVLSILFLGLLLGFCALLIDGGSWMWFKRSLQGDADAAALAAVREMPETPGSVYATAEQYVEVHNSDDAAVLDSAIPDFTDMSVAVTVSRDADSSPFGKLLGIDGAEITARARARVAQLSSIDGLLPFAALENTLEMTSPPTSEPITVSPTGILKGHIGAIAPRYSPPSCTSGTTNSANEIRDAIKSWHAGGVTTCGTEVGTSIDTAVGAIPNPIKVGLDTRLGPRGIHPDRFGDVFSWDADTGGYVLEKPESPRIGFIPIISTGTGTDDWADIAGVSTSVQVVDYVMVYIGRIGFPGEPAYSEGNDCVPQRCPGASIQVWVTPIPGMVTPNFDYELQDTWNADSLAPLAITLAE